ncbi:MAG: fibronectin type III domain-containing protein [Candidatus Scalindua sp.]
MRDTILACRTWVTITVINTDVSQVTISWNANTEPDLAGYKVHYGISSGNYDTNADIGNETSYALSNLASGVTYYITVTAYDSSGNESVYSDELIYNVPAF